ncbi:MAG: hypothetical protein KKB03_02935 [Nanoarchaeota archaeon]|nr:hypothetical protein [Nanoarchaeota archaeon]MBU1135516.1 hypothetical protein [Nanoarchaeota archaeon]MBU2520170.1 hypothetical protein [Nanoarchaeota archaeon]
MDFRQTKAIIGALLVLLLASMMIPNVGATNSDVFKPKTVMLQSAEAVYRENLGIAQSSPLQIKNINRLIERMSTDEDNFNRIVAISKLLIKPESKELIADDLLDMDRPFIRRLAIRASISELNKKEVTAQVSNYLVAKENKEDIGISLKLSLLKDFFTKKITALELIKSILQR